MQDNHTVEYQIPRTSIFDSTGARSKGLVFKIIESRYGAVLSPLLVCFIFSIRETVLFYAPRLALDAPLLPLDIVLGLIGTVGVLYVVGIVFCIADLGARGRLEKNESVVLLLYSIGVLVVVAQPALYTFDLPNTGLAFYHSALLPVLFFISCIVVPNLRKINQELLSNHS